MAEHTDSSELDLIASDDDETAVTRETGYSSFQDSESHNSGQMNETDNALCSGGDIESVENSLGNAYQFKDGADDEEEDTEAEEERERERVQGYKSELRTTDDVRKPVEVQEDLPFRDIIKAGAKKQEIQASEGLNQAKQIPLLGTLSKKRRGSTISELAKKKRNKDVTMPALLDKSQFNFGYNPSSDLQKGRARDLCASQGNLRSNQGDAQGTEKHTEGPSASKPSRQQSTIRSPETYHNVIKEAKDDQAFRDKEKKRGKIKTTASRQFREDCRDILDSIFKTMWDPKSQFISLTDPLPSYRVVDRVDAARNLEPVIDVIEDNEINHVLAAMLRVVNQVFLMRTIEVACAETSGSAHHAQGIVLQRIASHLQHRQVQRGKAPLSRTGAMAAARQLK